MEQLCCFFRRISRGQPARCGFTLIELLVVIAIIAVLAALGFGASRSAIETSNTAKCAANQKQIIAGILQFAQENNGLPPYITGGWYWNARLSRASNSSPAPTLPYMPYHPSSSADRPKGITTIWICPANNPFKTNSPVRDCSYGIPQAIYPNADNSSRVSLMILPKPSRTIALGDCSLTASSQNRIGSDGDIAKPHSGGANFAFFDGHVELLNPVPAYTNGMFKRTGGL
jgi:prepilin-type N-terminal cleavage/methylation domain-containing protein/prepilin-type processing-associated H-X9-DG protein